MISQRLRDSLIALSRFITPYLSLITDLFSRVSQLSPHSKPSQQRIASLSVGQRSATIAVIKSMLGFSDRQHISRGLILALTVFVFACAAFGQALPRPSASPSASPPSDPTANNPLKDDPDTNFGSPENEMRAKLLLKEEKKRYDENVARAREVSQLASQVSEHYDKQRAFNSDDAKRLERIEKLTKRIRNEAGGSDSDTNADIKDIPAEMRMLVKHVAERAGELQKMVEKTPRNVVSAAVIDQANKLLGLVQHLRNVSR